MAKKEIILPGLVFGISVVIIISYALNFVLVSDSFNEYRVMLAMMDSGTWAISHDQTLLVSSLLTTYIPGLIATRFSIPSEMVYRLFPVLFTVWTPLLVYLIARRYVTAGAAFIAALFLIGQNYYLWAASLARISIAVMFFALAIYCLIGQRLKGWRLAVVLVVCAGGIVFAHYGTAFLTLIMISAWLVLKVVVYVLKRGAVYPNWKYICCFFFIPLLVLSGIWHGVIIKNPGVIGARVVETAVSEVWVAVETNDIGFLGMDGKDMVIQVAFGSTFPVMNIAQKIEFIVSWLMILMVTFGLGYCLRKRHPLSSLAVVAYLLLIWTVLSPYTGSVYGIARVYFQSSIILLPGLVIGLQYLGGKLRVSPVLLGLVVAIPYILCTTGITHLFFGLTRSL